jgi:hypothetical protein
MKDPTPKSSDFLKADSILHYLAQNLLERYRIEGESYNREQMQKYANDVSSIIRVRNLLLDEAERITIHL